LGKNIFYGKAVAFTKHDLAKLPTTEVVKLNLVKKCILSKDTESHFLVLDAQYVLVGIPKTLALEQIWRPGSFSLGQL
jgi:hypothetical protein